MPPTASKPSARTCHRVQVHLMNLANPATANPTPGRSPSSAAEAAQPRCGAAGPSEWETFCLEELGSSSDPTLLRILQWEQWLDGKRVPVEALLRHVPPAQVTAEVVTDFV